MDARQSRRGKRISKQQEQRAASDLGGRLTAGSGAAKFSGGADVRVMGKTKVECKVTEGDSYTLKLVELEKLRKQAIKHLEYPVFQFALRDSFGRMIQFAVIPWDEWTGATTIHETENKSWTFQRSYLQAMSRDARIQVIFHAKKESSLKSRYFRLMHWEAFLERPADV
jgi:hypothetical protein